MCDPQAFRDLIDAYPFGMLVVAGADEVEIAHVPFLLDRDDGHLGTLRLHVARANPVWRAATRGRPVVAVFRGPDAYVSDSWCETPSEQVPTWNHVVVHAHGRVRERRATRRDSRGP
jgi:transcriptional regulator